MISTTSKQGKGSAEAGEDLVVKKTYSNCAAYFIATDTQLLKILDFQDAKA